MTNAHSRYFVGLAVLGFLGGTSVRTQDPAQFGIHLSEDEIKAVAGRVRAGRSLQPASWPSSRWRCHSTSTTTRYPSDGRSHRLGQCRRASMVRGSGCGG